MFIFETIFVNIFCPEDNGDERLPNDQIVNGSWVLRNAHIIYIDPIRNNELCGNL